jgi:hypothetical protein
MFSGVGQRLGIRISGCDDVDPTGCDVRRQKTLTPHAAPAAGSDLDDSVGHNAFVML